MRRLFFALCLLLAFGGAMLPAEAEEAAGVATVREAINGSSPQLEINIPGLVFSSPSTTIDKEGYLHVPFIGEFIVAVYKYAMVVGSILAVIMVIFSGVTIILSAGGEEKQAGYNRITQALAGLFILWGSYVILYTINPDLVKFKSLRVKYIVPIPLETYDKNDTSSEPGATSGQDEAGYIKYECARQPSNQTANYNGLDEYFIKYGKCIPYDWRLLKGLSFVESGHRPAVTNCAGFTGLFQTKTKYANSSLAQHKNITFGDPKIYEDVGKVNPVLKLPEPSLLVGTRMLLDSLSLIADKCKDADADTVFYFVYIGHQSGTGALKYVVDKTCSRIDSKKYVEAYYTEHKYKRPASDIANESDTGAERLLRILASFNIDKTKKPVNTAECPLFNSSLRPPEVFPAI